MSSRNNNTSSKTLKKQLKRSKVKYKNQQSKEPKLVVFDFKTMTIRPK